MKRSGLGRGVNAVLGDNFSIESINTQTDIDREYVHRIPINKIDVNKNQPRKTFNQDTIAALAESIKANGMLQPITVQAKGDRYEIIAGERRYRACRLLKLEEIPAIIKDLSPRQVCELALVENLQREDLNPIEAAFAIDSLMTEFKLTQQEVSERIGTSRPAIANALRLLKLPETVRALIINGSISAGHGRALAVLDDEKVIISIAELCAQNGLSVRQCEQQVKAYLNRDKKTPKPTTARAAEFDRIEENMRTYLQTKVKINGNEKKGKVEIEYFSRDDLERLIAILSPNGEL